jgi:hypothetical protein
MDGSTSDPAKATGYISIYNNVVVKTENFGIAIAAGHDISIVNNRVVSCDQDASGNWMSRNGYAYGMWDYYNVHLMYNNVVSGNSGGLILPDAQGKPINSDFYTPAASPLLENTVVKNAMDHPCWIGGVLSQAAESVERTAWDGRVSQSGEFLGDLH